MKGLLPVLALSAVAMAPGAVGATAGSDAFAIDARAWRGDRHFDFGSDARPALPSGKRLALDIGPQLQGPSGDRSRIGQNPSGQPLNPPSPYALIGFAGYRSQHGWALGPEAWFNADPGYRVRGLGVAMHDLRAGSLRIDLRLGATRRQDQGRAINGGIEFRWSRP